MSNIVALETIKKDTFSVSPDDLIGSVVSKNDFAIINGKVEITRDLSLKLFTATKTESYRCELQEVVNAGADTVYIVKATVSRQGKLAEGLGACSTSEIEKRKGGTRAHHDALATAETRAYKRALEAVVGLPFINEIILKLFGDYEVREKKEITITPEELVQKIEEAKAMPHLKNIWLKYQGVINNLPPEQKRMVIQLKEQKKNELTRRKEDVS